ncbi:hypothetical protein [Psychroserpens ponticola]|uniref:Uncharacterized protein n=1 Tax=Psychroserpens ponticola TaxID=2932268 RepID=A0ABY7RWR3_9FLAO|nr:hypothetical protein [Psychroserpens ponticola]WCO01586.1 hypothetical protein MUN68_016170 [Psychroserpens ponticola]
MKKNLINFIATIIIALILSQFLPWWSVMLASFLTAIIFALKKSAVFYIPFLAIAVFWIVYAFWLSSSNDFTLSKKIAVLLPFQGNPYILILVTGIIGGLAAGIAAIFGKQCATLLKTKA